MPVVTQSTVCGLLFVLKTCEARNSFVKRRSCNLQVTVSIPIGYMTGYFDAVTCQLRHFAKLRLASQSS